MLTGQTAMDGGLVVWVGPDGQEISAVPLGGYGGRISAKSFNLCHTSAKTNVIQHIKMFCVTGPVIQNFRF